VGSELSSSCRPLVHTSRGPNSPLAASISAFNQKEVNKTTCHEAIRTRQRRKGKERGYLEHTLFDVTFVQHPPGPEIKQQDDDDAAEHGDEDDVDGLVAGGAVCGQRCGPVSVGRRRGGGGRGSGGCRVWQRRRFELVLCVHAYRRQ